jgi:hypothetical protein
MHFSDVNFEGISSRAKEAPVREPGQQRHSKKEAFV